MTRAWLWVSSLTRMGSGAAQAASYQLGVPPFSVVGPIQNTYGGNSSYSGSNLEPSADLNYADLSHANLSNASLSDSNLSSTLLYSADFGGTASWLWATWTGAKYSINAVDHLGNPIPDTIFPTGMDQAWRDAAGVVAVPEPTTALLFGFGLPLIRTRIAATSLTRGIPCAAA